MPRFKGLGRAVVVVLGATLVTLATTGGAAKDKVPPDKAFQKAKKDYQLKARSKKPADRIAALKLLADFPNGEAAEVVYVTLLDDKIDEVREAAVKSLTAICDSSEVTESLLKRMTNSTLKGGMDIRSVGALQALAGTADEDAQRLILKFLNEFLGTSSANLHRLYAMIDEQAAQGEAESVLRMLLLFSQARYFEANFGFRRCIVQGIMQVKDQEGIMHLINLLPRLNGLVQFDVISHLVMATGENFGDDAVKWKAWWAKNKGNNQPPEKSEIPPVGNYGNFGDYYGIPICAKRVVFVLDTSLSMRGSKIDAAKTELIRAIKALPKEVNFDVIAFDNNVRVWQPELVPATEPLKQVAVNVVIEQPLKLKTASYDALEAAFSLDPEVIYFLSDGAPFGGKIDDPNEIIRTISGINRVRRVSIHSIGIGTREARAAVFGQFMKGLAEANWGIYKPVN